MRPAHRTTCLLVGVLLVLTGACKNKKEITAAKTSLYDTEFATVYNAALEAVREQYANLDDNPRTGVIKTAWHQVSANNDSADVANQQTVGTSAQALATGGTGMPTRLAYKRQFVRFDVSVIGGRPWRVKVIGKAAEWEPGNALPTELHGMARPPWLDGRIESVQVAIYRRLKPYGVPMPKEDVVEKEEPEMPKTDPGTFVNVPGGAAKQLAAIKDALAVRDYQALRLLVADDVTWSLGAEPGAETAMAMWQADAESLDAMAQVIAGGCGVQAGKVLCPAQTPPAGKFQLVLGQVGTTWKVTSFLRVE